MRSKPWVPAPLRDPLAPLRRALDPWLSWRPPLPRHLRLQRALMRDEWRLRHLRSTPEPWPQALDWGSGLSVVIPERGGVDLLGQCLAATQEALIRVHEPTEIIVVVNGSPESDYAALRARHPGVLWRLRARGLARDPCCLSAGATGMDRRPPRPANVSPANPSSTMPRSRCSTACPPSRPCCRTPH